MNSLSISQSILDFEADAQCLVMEQLVKKEERVFESRLVDTFTKNCCYSFGKPARRQAYKAF